MSIIELAALVWLIGKLIGVVLFLGLLAMFIPAIIHNWWSERKSARKHGGEE